MHSVVRFQKVGFLIFAVRKRGETLETSMEHFDACMYVGKSKLFDGCAGWIPSMKVVTASINRIYKLNLRLTGSNPQSCANRIAQMMASSPVRAVFLLPFCSVFFIISEINFNYKRASGLSRVGGVYLIAAFLFLFFKRRMFRLIYSVKVQCSFFIPLFQANPLPHGLDKIADVQGYLVLNSDGAVLAVSTLLVQSMVDIVYVLLGISQVLLSWV